MTPVAQAIDWTQFWQPIVNALPGLVVAFFAFLGVVLGGAALTIRAAVKNTWDKEKFFLEMQKSNNDELKTLRADQRESDRREIGLRDEINQVRVDGDRKLNEAVVESDQKMAVMKADYEKRIADLEATIESLQTELEAKEVQLQLQRKRADDAEMARDLANMQRDKDHNDFKQKIVQFEQKIEMLQRQVAEQKTNTAELKAAQEKPGE